jgi:dihydroflavonol-4-reductase
MILVTGGTGMVGAHLLYELVNSGEKVRAIYRSERAIEKVKKVFSYYSDTVDTLIEKIDWVQGDLLDITSLELAFEGVVTVFHAAALVSFRHADYEQLRRVNIEGTATIVNLSIAFSIKKLIYVSSIAAISKTVGKELVDETDDFNLDTNNYGYAITKYGAEMEVWRGSQEGLNVLVVNPGVVLGPGYWNENSGAMFAMVSKGFPFYTEGITGFIGVDDVVKALLLLYRGTLVNERFVLVSENISFKSVLYHIAGFFGKKPPRFKVTRFMAEAGWRLAWLYTFVTGRSNSFSKHTAKSASKNSFYNSDKIQQATGMEFEPMEKVIEAICAKYKNG